jgi:transaldolase / glucose-6-phosphate isomerase
LNLAPFSFILQRTHFRSHPRAKEQLMTNRLAEIMKLGQSIWFDNIRRSMLTGGELRRMVEEDDLRGVTSNPTIFEKAITGSGDYDEQLRELVAAGRTAQEIYEELVVSDIARAADVLRPVYEREAGRDGFISLEVNPRLAYDTAATIEEAERLFRRLGRPNVMIKIPASQEGLPAIEESIRRGINVNITMIFSIENYEQVAESFVRGLERRAEAGEPVAGIASVASFFVSRVDTAVDAELERRAHEAATPEERGAYEALRGRAAVANAKLAYQKFKEIFHGPRFAALREAGAQAQRPLWASTGTKNPQYSDVLYVDNLIGPETVNTVPPATYEAIRDHGRVAATIEDDLEAARACFAQLAAFRIDLTAVTEKLQRDGLDAFVKSFDDLLDSIRAKRAALASRIDERLVFSPGRAAEAARAALEEAGRAGVVGRIWRGDAGVWKSEEKHRETIGRSLGWLRVAEEMAGEVGALREFAEEVRGAGFRHALVCGMGGSSLCTEVLRQTFGRQEGYPELLVLDSTDPDVIADFEGRVDLARCLFVIASKSGTTTEPLAFYKYWFERVSRVSDAPGHSFVAITDPGTPLQSEAERKQFRRVFAGRADIGGRYSALSNFGLVPAALMGLDVKTFVGRAVRAAHAGSQAVPAPENAAARLGALVAECALAGRDKLTVTADPRVASLGLWVEQLVAESTGKEGRGVVPVAGEPLGPPSAYGDDRLFVHVAVGETDAQAEGNLRALEAAGHPVVRRTLADLYDLGEEFFLWELATAFAGWRLGINPFDQPNVQESKDATRALLEAFARDGRLPEQTPLASEGELAAYADGRAGDGPRASSSAGADSRASSLGEVISSHLSKIRAGDYVALLAYFEETPEHARLLEEIRLHLRDATRAATTLGYGPRFLHSTGQLHKGGSDAGVFLQLTARDRNDLPVPGEPYTFSTLKEAQALGDFQSLAAHGRRALRLDLGADVAAGLRRLRELVLEALTLSQASRTAEG